MTRESNLQRFVDAQDERYEAAIDELHDGRKTSHWMWFVFPQLRGLGHSAMAERYGIASIEEARAYLRHPLLRERLVECTRLTLRWAHRPAHELFGAPDDRKFHACMTLFHRADPAEPVFDQALREFFDGREDPLTLERLD